MTSGGSVSVDIRLALDKLRADAAAAVQILGSNIKDPELDVLLKVDKAQNLLASLQRDALKAKSAIASDAGEALMLQKEAALLQEALEYKQRLAAIKDAFVNQEDVANATKLAEELSQANKAKIERDFTPPQAAPVDTSLIGKLNAQAAAFQESISKSSQYTQALGVVSQQLKSAGSAVEQFSNQSQAAAAALDSAQAALETLGVNGKEVTLSLGKLAKELNYSASTTELVASAYDVYSARTETLTKGLTDAEVATNILSAATIGAIGGFSNVNTVADATTSVLNAYGESADKAGAYVDKFSATQNAGKITIDQYAQQIGRVASVAAQAGVGIDELNGFIATATVKGVPVESTFAGIRQAISAVLKPTDEAKDAAAALGIAFDAQTLRTKGLSGILGELNAKGKDTPETLLKLFGSVEAVSAIAPAAGAGFKNLQTNIDLSANSAGTAQQAYGKVAASLKGQLNAAANEANVALVSLGKGANDAFVPLILSLGKLVSAFNSLPDGVKEAIGATIAFTGGTLTLVGALAGFAAILPSISAGLKFVGLQGVVAGEGLVATGAGGAVATGSLSTLGTAIGGLTLKLGLMGVAAAVLQTAFSRFSDGGAVFNKTADDIKKSLLDLQIEAGKTKKDLEAIVPKDPPPTDFIDDIATKFNNFTSSYRELVGLPKDLILIPTNAQKQLSDARLGVSNLQDTVGLLTTKAREISGGFRDGLKPTEAQLKQATAVQQQFTDAIAAANQSLGTLDPSKLGSTAYEQLSKQVKATIAELEREKALLEKRAGLAKTDANGTVVQTQAIKEQGTALERLTAKQQESADLLTQFNKLKQAGIAESVAQGFITEEQGRQQNLDAEKAYLSQRLSDNRAALLQLKDLEATTRDPAELAKVKAEIIKTEQSIADDRIAIAQKATEARKAAEQDALQGVEDAYKKSEAAIAQSQNGRILGVKQALASGAIDEQEAATQIAQIQESGVGRTIAAKQKELSDVRALRAQGKISAEESAKQEAALVTELGALSIQQVDAEINAQKLLRAERLKGIEEANAAAEKAIANDTSGAIATVKENQLPGLEAEKDAQREIQAIQLEGIRATLQQKRDEYDEIAGLVDQGLIDEEEANKRRLALEGEINQARSQFADAEQARTKALKQEKLDAIQDELDAVKRSAEVRQGLLDLEQQSLANSNNLLSAQSGLLTAQNNLRQQRLQFALEDAQAAGNGVQSERIRNQIIAEQIADQEQQFAIAQLQLELKQQQIALDLRGREISAEIAVQEAQIAIQEAIVNGDKEKIAGLRTIAGLRREQLAGLGEQAAAQERINQLERNALNTTQQAGRERLQRQARIEAADANKSAADTPSAAPSNGVTYTNFSTRTGVSPQARPNDQSLFETPVPRADLSRLLSGSQAETARLQNLSSVGAVQPGGIGGAEQGAVVGKLDQLIAAVRQASGRPNLTITRPDDVGLAGKIYADISRDSTRAAGL